MVCFEILVRWRFGIARARVCVSGERSRWKRAEGKTRGEAK